ncbi:MAG: NAD-dependent epimerase/dehydratase family protein [Euryarchaeota archaeon]|nr:NAD-dependent epimerase/dehydratase family protein [Euryarchaeota archaeon]
MIGLVTGGYGFIGNQLVGLLSNEFSEVRVLDNLSSVARVVRLPNVHFIKGDIRDAETTFEALKDVDVVFHTAAQIDVVASTREPFVDLENNILGTLSVCEAARKNDISKIIYSSSAAVYGKADVFPINEMQPIRPISQYAASKYSGELYLAAYHSLYGIDEISLRYFNVYGPYQRPENAYSGVISKFFYDARSNAQIQIFGDGKQTRDFVYVKDVARANLLAAKSKATNTAINVGSGVETSINDLAEKIKEILPSDARIVHVTPRVGDGRRSLADISLAKKLINYEPETKLADGLEKLNRFMS